LWCKFCVSLDSFASFSYQEEKEERKSFRSLVRELPSVIRQRAAVHKKSTNQPFRFFFIACKLNRKQAFVRLLALKNPDIAGLIC